MVDTLTWVLAGIAIYTLAVLLLKRQGRLPEAVGVQGPIITLHTQRGKQLIERLSRHRRFWRAWANFGVGIALVVMVGSFLFLVFSGLAIVQSPPEPTAVNQPRNVLVIPGVNDFLPLSVAPEIVAGLVVGLVVHEGGHGLLCRVEDIEIDSLGLAFFAFVPVGAFVEPDQESQKKASRGGRTRMFAAGVTNNFAVTLVAFALLFGPVIASIGVAPGAAVGGVLPGSPADTADLDAGDRITAINGSPVANNSDLDRELAAVDSRQVRVQVDDTETRTMTRRLVVTGTVPSSPAGIPRGANVTTVNGTNVFTESGFLEAVSQRTVVSVSTAGGDTYRFPAGAYSQVVEGGPLSASVPDEVVGEFVVITELNGERIYSGGRLREVLADAAPGDTFDIVAYVDGAPETYTVTLGEDDEGGAILGIRLVPGVTGLSVDDFGIRTYPAGDFLAALGGSGGDSTFGPLVGSFIGKMVIALVLPIGGVIGAFEFNFAGFAGFNTGFYVATGPLGFLGGWIFLVANLLFWIGWINVQLGFFNCIPAFPLDGGHILRTSTEAVVSRLPVNATRGMVRTVTTTVGLTMLLAFLVLVFGPGLLAGG